MENAGFDASIYSLTYEPEKPLWAADKKLPNFTLELAMEQKQQKYLPTFHMIKFETKYPWHANIDH